MRGCGRSLRRTPVHERATARKLGLADCDWVWVESPHARSAAASAPWKGSSRTPCGRGMRSASRRARGALKTDAPEATAGFLLNHLIAELLPEACRRRKAPDQFGSRHRPGGLVRPARQRHQVRARRDRHLAQVCARQAHPRRQRRAAPGAALRREMSMRTDRRDRIDCAANEPRGGLRRMPAGVAR